MSSEKPFFLCGATASGKSAIAVALARRVGGEIINADAFQLYKGLDICTAKPLPSERAIVPHHLFDVLEPWDACDAQRYRDLAEPAIRDVLARGRWPIVVGGSGLYIKSLTHGLAPLPKADAALRQKIAKGSAEERVAELIRLDPDAASNVPLRNDRYVSRALEICLLTQQPQSTLRKQWQENQPRFMGALLSWQRDDLYLRINQRVLQMVAMGAVEEVRELLNSLSLKAFESSADEPPDLGSDTTAALKAIGVREIIAHLRGELALQDTICAIQQATRRYAKRQATWFRREQGFQTICLAQDSNPAIVVERILDLFPCLSRPPQPAPSSST